MELAPHPLYLIVVVKASDRAIPDSIWMRLRKDINAEKLDSLGVIFGA